MTNDYSQVLVEQVLDARTRGARLNIEGRGSKKFLGREVFGEIISVAPHRGIVSLQPEELILTVRAGTLVSEIQDTLDEHALTLSFEPPTFENCASIGGTLACHLSGPSRPWKGSVRDMVLGLKLINGKGEHLSFGGQVIKNVAGYDVSRLQAGAMGTLGIITEISFKVLPKPDAELTLVESIPAEAAIEKMNRIAGEPKPLSAACWWQGKTYLRFSGTQSAIDSVAAQWRGKTLEEGARFWHGLREQQLAFFQSAGQLQRFSVKSSATHALADQDWLIDWGGAQRWLGFSDPAPFTQEALENIAESMGGQVSRYRGGQRNTEVFHTQSPAMQKLLCRVKQALDPDGIFNPGRMYSWL